eukprot:1159647-Pelagomonas_calceolata.AAC.1
MQSFLKNALVSCSRICLRGLIPESSQGEKIVRSAHTARLLASGKSHNSHPPRLEPETSRCMHLGTPYFTCLPGKGGPGNVMP